MAKRNITKAKAVDEMVGEPSTRDPALFAHLCPRANPIERAFGDVHDLCSRNHTRKRLPDLVADVEAHLHVNGPSKYQLSELYYESAVTTAVENIARDEHTKVAA